MSVRMRALILAAITTATIGCDQATKHLAAAHLADQPRRSYLSDIVRLQYVQNPGAFLGFGAHLPVEARRAVFTIGTAVALAATGVLYLRHTWTATSLLGLAMLWAGGLSNLIDRVLYGRVSDFLNVGIGWLRTGIFNVADMVIMLGMLLVLADHWRRSRDGGSEQET
jgi:signal peptidase II